MTDFTMLVVGIIWGLVMGIILMTWLQKRMINKTLGAVSEMLTDGNLPDITPEPKKTSVEDLEKIKDQIMDKLEVIDDAEEKEG